MSFKCCLVVAEYIKASSSETLSIFTIFVFASRTSSIMLFIRDLSFIFIFIFIMINRIISWIQTHLIFWLFFRMWLIVFGKFSLRVLLSICLILCQLHPGVAYKCCFYKKNMYLKIIKKLDKKLHSKISFFKRKNPPLRFFSILWKILFSANSDMYLKAW